MERTVHVGPRGVDHHCTIGEEQIVNLKLKGPQKDLRKEPSRAWTHRELKKKIKPGGGVCGDWTTTSCAWVWRGTSKSGLPEWNRKNQKRRIKTLNLEQTKAKLWLTLYSLDMTNNPHRTETATSACPHPSSLPTLQTSAKSPLPTGMVSPFPTPPHHHWQPPKCLLASGGPVVGVAKGAHSHVAQTCPEAK